MKAFTMSDLKRKGDAPLSPRELHQLNVGSGNYNRYAPLLPPPAGRPRINSKRKFEVDQAGAPPKTPKLDRNVVFEQLKASEEAMTGIKDSFKDALSIGENCYTATDGGTGEAFFKLAKTVELLITNQEKMFSMMVDAVGVAANSAPSSYASAVARDPSKARDSTRSRLLSSAQADPRPKKLRQALSKAEKSVTIFDLDLGPVPMINRESLSRKVTLLLHEKARTAGIYKDNPDAASESMDDILSCASIDFLGKGSTLFYNTRDTTDVRNNKMCTVPVKLTFRDKNSRFQAEQTLKKACKVKCSTPYPKKLRMLIDSFVKECKVIKPGCFILTKVDIEKLCVTARARTDDGWVVIDNKVSIPLDLLDPVELAAAAEGEDESEMSCIS
jgi:hypothetical protein